MANLQYIKVKGSFGIHYGLGVDEIAVNFENLSGLINLAGNNGQGKTTFMELLSPFPVFPSRQQKNPQKYNFKKQFRLRDSYKEVCYLFQGKKYVFRVEIPAGTTMSPEGYIYCDGVPVVKGKISEYKKKVSELFGSEDLFYSSIFSCQGGKKLTDLKTGEFKQLLIELLGLEKYTTYWHNAGACIKECEGALSEVIRDLEYYSAREDEISRNATSLAENRASFDVKKAEISEGEKKVSLGQEELATLQRESAEVQKQEAVLTEKRKQLSAIADQIVVLKAEMLESSRKHNDWIDSKEEEIFPLQSLVDQKEEILSAERTIAELMKEESTLAADIEAVSIEATVNKEKLSDIYLALVNLKSDRIGLDNDPVLKGIVEYTKLLNVDKSETERKIADINIKLAALGDDPVIKALRKDLEQFKAAESLLALRPDGCGIDACPFIKNAFDKIGMKPAKEKEIADAIEKNKGLILAAEHEKEEIFASLNKAVMTIKSVACEKDTLTAESDQKRKDLNKKETELLTEMTKLEKRKDSLLSGYTELKLKQSVIPEKISRLEILSMKKSEMDLAEQKIALLQTSIEERNQAFASRDFDFRTKIVKLESEAAPLSLDVIMSTPARTQENINIDIDITEQGIRIAQLSLKVSIQVVSDIEKTIAVLEDKAMEAKKDIEEITRLKLRESFIREEIGKWAYVRDAVSKSGLQALEISAAAPLLTGIANDLLHAAYGGEFYLDLITQDPETGAEVLDIMITRGDGQSYSLCDFSGGESVWILQAFKAAQILVNTEKSGIHFATCFADEESGALDKEKAERFIQMYRALMVQGHFEKLFFISHIPECQAMADHSLLFQKGGIVSESGM